MDQPIPAGHTDEFVDAWVRRSLAELGDDILHAPIPGELARLVAELAGRR